MGRPHLFSLAVFRINQCAGGPRPTHPRSHLVRGRLTPIVSGRDGPPGNGRRPLPPRALRTGLVFVRFGLERALLRARGRDPRPVPGGPPFQRGHDATAPFEARLAAPGVEAAWGELACWRRVLPPTVADAGLRFAGAHRRATADGDADAARAAFAGLGEGGGRYGSVQGVGGGGGPMIDMAALARELESVGWWLWTEEEERRPG